MAWAREADSAPQECRRPPRHLCKAGIHCPLNTPHAILPSAPLPGSAQGGPAAFHPAPHKPAVPWQAQQGRRFGPLPPQIAAAGSAAAAQRGSGAARCPRGASTAAVRCCGTHRPAVRRLLLLAAGGLQADVQHRKVLAVALALKPGAGTRQEAFRRNRGRREVSCTEQEPQSSSVPGWPAGTAPR